MSIVSKKIMMGSGAAGDPVDDEFNRTSFLSHFEGANNGVNNAFDDGSTSNHTITANGNVTQGSFGPFARPDGEWGWSFDGNGDSLTFTNDATMSLDGDYTFELFFNARTIVLDTQHPNTWLSGTTQLYIHASGRYISWYAGGGNIVHSANDAILTNVWNHVAIVRSGTGSNNTSMYLNGTRVQQATNTATLGASSGTARIGSYSASGGNFDGHISNIRIIKGTALYSGSSITVPTSALTAITNTKLLTCQSNRFIDNSSTGFALTPVGNTAVTAFSPFLTSSVYDAAVNGASGSFASGNYLTASADADFTIGTGNFTVEFWIYPTDLSEPYMPVVTIGENSGGLIIGKSEADGTGFGAYPKGISGNIIRTNTLPQLNAWTHVLYSRSGTSVKMFYNGVQAASSTSSYDFQAGALTVGSYSGYSRYWAGNITDLRYVKGTATVTSNFTPPTAPLTAITNTKLLLNMADAQAIDSAAQNNLTFNGTSSARPKISTSVKKFGDSSFYVPDSTFAISTDGPSFGTGDFTVEMWIYWAGSPGAASTIYSQITSNSDAGTEGPHLYWDNSTQKIIYFANNGNRITSTNAVSNTTWYHLALCRASGSTKMFLDGTQTGSTYSDTINFTGAANIQIGTYRLNGTGVARNNQYYDDLRVSSFARYTSNFTAPAEPFADKGQ